SSGRKLSLCETCRRVSHICSRLSLFCRADDASSHEGHHQGIPRSLWELMRLSHAVIAVPDMEKATVPLPEHGVYIVIVELGNTKLELLHLLGEKSSITGLLQKKNLWIHHILDILYGSGLEVMFLHRKDCDGVLVEVEEA
uniref:Uncharacterized protein n=1 Tax=Echeneis naucrates TaxID=173247 RepID=A0A665WXY3_ECHNA